MTDTRTLLDDYAVGGSEPAFREVVERYLNLVYSTALRLLDGNAALAEDVTQTVFIDLARQAGRLSARVMVGGWLHRRTCHVAATVRRSERRRHTRERVAMELQSLHHDTDEGLARIAPILDEAINQLATADRAAIVLRFFEQRDFRSVGDALGTKEDAARMRVNRALEKLHRALSSHGVSLSAAALGAALTSGAVSAAPTGLAASVAATALAGAAASGGVSLTLYHWILMSKLKTAAVCALVLGSVATPLALHYNSTSRLLEENRAMRQQLEQAHQLVAENTRLSNLVSQSSAADVAVRNQQSELLKLRGEVGRLRKQVAEAASSRKTQSAPRTASSGTGQEEQEAIQQQALAKMGYAKNWMLAFFLYSAKNQEQIPADFESASSFLPETGKDETLLATNQFEILYQGSLSGITNPASAIVLRETQPFQGPGGAWLRTYGFADGHTEVHRADDGNFEPWEAAHVPQQGPKVGGL